MTRLAALSLAVSAVTMLLPSSASAAITHSLVQVFPAGLAAGLEGWDLQVTVSAGDDWISTDMSATAAQGSFVDPVPFFTFNAGLSNHADLWFSATGFGNPTPSFVSGPFVSPAGVSAIWFDTPPNGGAGTWTIARLVATDNAIFTLTGLSTTQQGGQPTPYTLTNVVPGPGALALLVIGSMIGVSRRRGGGKYLQQEEEQ